MSAPQTTAERRALRRRERRALDALPVRPEPTTGFVVKKPVGTYDQIEVVRAAVTLAILFGTHAERDAARFTVHLLTAAGREDGGEDDGFVAVPAKVIERYFRHLDWRALEEAGLIEVKPYSRLLGRCREFRVAEELRLAFYEAGPTTERVMQDGLYDLATGRPTSTRTKSQRRTPSGNALPKMVRAAIDAVGMVPFDAVRIERDHLPSLRAKIDEAEPGTKERERALGRYLNDLRCFQAVLTQGARPLDPAQPDGLWVYRPAYRPQRFGRISQVGGGLQSCSKEMKSISYPPIYPPSLWASS